MGSISDRMEAGSASKKFPTSDKWTMVIKKTEETYAGFPNLFVSVKTFVCTQCSETIPEKFVKQTHFECHRCKKGWPHNNCECETTVEANCPNC